jgi:hypothetical protein
MATAGEVLIKISAEGAEATQSALKSVGDAMDTMGGIAIGAAAAGIAAVGAGLTIAVDEAMQFQNVMARTNSVLASTGGVAGMSASDIVGYGEALAQTVPYSHDAIQAGENVMLMFTRIGKDVFPQAMAAAVDYASVMGTDVTSAAMAVGKALGDPEAGVGRLNTQFRVFTAEQQKAIEKMAKMGDIAGAQAAILQGLNAKFGGAAEAAGKTFAGQLEIAKNKLKDMAEEVGNHVLPILSQFMANIGPGIQAAMTTALPFVEKMVDDIGRFAANIQKGMDPAIAFKGLLHDMLPANIASQFGGAIDAISNFVAGFQATVLPQLQAVGADIMKSFGEAFGAQGPQIIANITAFFNNLAPALSNAMKVLGPVLEVAGKVLAQAVAGIVNIFSGLAAAITQVMSGNLQGALNTIVATFTNFANSVSQAFGGVNFSAVLATWGSVLSTAGTIISASAANAMAAAQNWANGVVGSILGPVAQIPGNVVGYVMGAVTAIQGLVGSASAAGAALSAGIAAGIKSYVASVIAAAVAVVEAAIAAAKAAAGISSPSKVMAEAGGFMSQGFAIGITDKAKMAVDAMRGLTNLAIQPAMAAPGMMAPAAAGAGAGMGGGGGNMFITLNAQGITDPREHVDMIERELRSRGKAFGKVQ